MRMETKKIIDESIELVATCVRVPVFVGHSEAVNVELEDPLTVEQARELFRNADGEQLIRRVHFKGEVLHRPSSAWAGPVPGMGDAHCGRNVLDRRQLDHREIAMVVKM